MSKGIRHKIYRQSAQNDFDLTDCEKDFLNVLIAEIIVISTTFDTLIMEDKKDIMKSPLRTTAGNGINIKKQEKFVKKYCKMTNFFI